MFKYIFEYVLVESFLCKKKNISCTTHERARANRISSIHEELHTCASCTRRFRVDAFPLLSARAGRIMHAPISIRSNSILVRGRRARRDEFP